MIPVILLLAVLAGSGWGQQVRNSRMVSGAGVDGERLLAVVPMVGAGTPADPRRPLFAPAGPVVVSGDARAASAGITGFSYVVSDDGRMALVEFVARDAGAFQAIVRSGRADVKTFERGKATLVQAQEEFRKHKPGFEIGRFVGVGGGR